jgi:hypothetical protein
MDYLICKFGVYAGLKIDIPLENIKDDEEAIYKAREIALETKEGATIGLFTRDGHPICGWKVMKDDKVTDEPVDVIEQMCGVAPDSFDLAKRQADKIRKARENKHE